MKETLTDTILVDTDLNKNMNCEINFIGGLNFIPSPLKKMQLLWSSAIIGEPQYYQLSKSNSDENYNKNNEIFIDTLREALNFDYKSVLNFAIKLRNQYLMRLGPQIILVEASIHPNRQKFNEKNPMFFRNVAKEIILLPTDLYSQLEFYLKINGNKSKLPVILKRCWKDAIERMSLYQLNKYLHKAHIIDLIRLSHPRSNKNYVIQEIIKNGKIEIKDGEITWEKLKSEGKTWKEIISILNTRFPHMALLRNLRNIAKELNYDELTPILQQLEYGVIKGKQFPFRYYTAYNLFKNENDYKYKKICKSLEQCMQISLANLNEIDGNVVSLCDNSGSARGIFNSSYGNQTVATIGNLSGLLSALKATGAGYVDVFGDGLEIYQVSKDKGILQQLDYINNLGKTVGQATKNGIWLWFKKAFHEKDLYKNVNHLFIYSDMQAGHGELYGIYPKDYEEFVVNDEFIDVIKLVERHRKFVNDKFNIFTIQTAGYKNTLIPEYCYRTCILSGWTGNEINYASSMIELWKIIEAKKKDELHDILISNNFM